MTPAKEWWQSWTIWWNVASAVIAIAGVFTDPALAGDPRVVSIATMVVTVGNVLLRLLKTNQPIAGTPAADNPPTA